MKFLYNKTEIYEDKFFMYLYNDNNFRIVCQKYHKKKGFEEVKNYIDFLGTDEEESNRVSLSRTKRNIRELCLCNNFTHFATLTINSKSCDRFSLDECQNKLKYIIQERIRRKNKDFAYIFITEKHKNGAFHFHGLVKNLDLYENENGFLSSKVFDEIGFNSFSLIKDFEKTCNYITKYITKDCVRNSHKQIYISSRGLKKAESYEILPVDINWTYENDFVKVRDFNLSQISNLEKLQLMSIIAEPDPRFYKERSDVVKSFIITRFAWSPHLRLYPIFKQTSVFLDSGRCRLYFILLVLYFISGELQRLIPLARVLNTYFFLKYKTLLYNVL